MPWICLIVMFVGLAMYLFLDNVKGQEIGRLMFFAALLGFMIAVAPDLAAKLRKL